MFSGDRYAGNVFYPAAFKDAGGGHSVEWGRLRRRILGSCHSSLPRGVDHPMGIIEAAVPFDPFFVSFSAEPSKYTVVGLVFGFRRPTFARVKASGRTNGWGLRTKARGGSADSMVIRVCNGQWGEWLRWGSRLKTLTLCAHVGGCDGVFMHRCLGWISYPAESLLIGRPVCTKSWVRKYNPKKMHPRSSK